MINYWTSHISMYMSKRIFFACGSHFREKYFLFLSVLPGRDPISYFDQLKHSIVSFPAALYIQLKIFSPSSEEPLVFNATLLILTVYQWLLWKMSEIFIQALRYLNNRAVPSPFPYLLLVLMLKTGNLIVCFLPPIFISNLPVVSPIPKQSQRCTSRLFFFIPTCAL